MVNRLHGHKAFLCVAYCRVIHMTSVMEKWGQTIIMSLGRVMTVLNSHMYRFVCQHITCILLGWINALPVTVFFS